MAKAFLFIILSYLVFFVLTPPFQVPDEPEHYENVFWLSQGVYPRLPKLGEKNYRLFVQPLFNLYDSTEVIRDSFVLPNFPKIKSPSSNIKPEIPISTQSYHPPLYYVFAASFFKLANLFHFNLVGSFYFTRLSSALFYFLSVFVAYKILGLVIKSRDSVGHLLLFFAINPVTLKMGVGINNEIAVTFFSLLFLYLLLRFEQKILFLAVVSSFAALSKFSGAFTALVFGFFSYWKYKVSKRGFLACFKYISVFLIILLPWFLFNYFRYHNPIQDNFALICKKDFLGHNVFSTFFYSLYEFRHTINHYAGFLGWGEPYPFKFFFIGYTVAFAFLFLIGLMRLIGPMRRGERKTTILLSYIFSLFFFLFVLDFYRKLSHFSCDIQGRYLLPAFLPITIVLAKGIKSTKLLAYFAIFQYYFILFFVLIPKYYV